MTPRDAETQADLIERAAQDCDTPLAVACTLMSAAIAILSADMGYLPALHLMADALRTGAAANAN